MRDDVQRFLHDAIETHFAECPSAGGVEMCEHLAGFVNDPEWQDAAGCAPTAWAYGQACKALARSRPAFEAASAYVAHENGGGTRDAAWISRKTDLLDALAAEIEKGPM